MEPTALLLAAALHLASSPVLAQEPADPAEADHVARQRYQAAAITLFEDGRGLGPARARTSG